jgi:hypothetical protein
MPRKRAKDVNLHDATSTAYSTLVISSQHRTALLWIAVTDRLLVLSQSIGMLPWRTRESSDLTQACATGQYFETGKERSNEVDSSTALSMLTATQNLGPGGSERTAEWTLYLAPTADESACPISLDSNQQAEQQLWLKSWIDQGVGGLKLRPEKGMVALSRCQELSTSHARMVRQLQSCFPGYL